MTLPSETLVKVPYELLRSANAAICPECGSRRVSMLAPTDLDMVAVMPLFYVCTCGWVGQCTVGTLGNVHTRRKS